MATEDLVSLHLVLPLSWWQRLQCVAHNCLTSPGEFVREVLEAEVVRRELLGEPSVKPLLELDWLGENTGPSSTQLH